jgi:ATP-dependent helicase HrpA
VPSPSAYVLEHLTAAEKLSLAASPYPSAKALIEDARVAVADAVMARVAPGGIRTTADFEAARAAFSAAVVDDLFQAVSLVARILTLQRDVERAVKRQNSMTLLAALGDVKAQLAGLVRPASCRRRAGPSRPPPRYLQGRSRASRTRRQPRAGPPADDRVRARRRVRRRGRRAPRHAGCLPALLARARWLLEEYRVSLFAQQLGTAEPVSLQRITKTLAGRE